MDIYKKRRILLIAVLAVLFFMITAIIFSCSRNSQEENNSVSDDSSVVSDNNTPDPDITQPVVTDSTIRPSPSGFTDRNKLNLADTDYVPDDILYIDQEYLKSILVVGDSIAKGYSVYNRLPAESVLAMGSIGVKTVMETLFDYQGEQCTLTDVIEKNKPKYVFVSLGMNDIHTITQEEYIKQYKSDISEILKRSPDSKIIIMAVTPVTEANEFTDNTVIDTYNEALRKMVYDLHNDNVFFLDAAQNLKNEKNNLKDDLSSGDGIHLSGAAYDTLLSYMLTMLEWI